ncbi:hypothetical protein GCM10010234_38780 [Streptomyces hawaiiensis]|uniref:hypothetical protein n=1 Tax=Streptomyces hawaiiensis TaxID=67305 RepID=UPI0031D18828
MRDALFTERLREETTRLGLPSLTVDGTITEDELAERVSEVFRLRHGEGPGPARGPGP